MDGRLLFARVGPAGVVAAALIFVLSGVIAGAGQARAEAPTPLLSDDLQANRRTRIDGGGDDGLDALFANSGGFSTKKLEPVEDRLRAELRRERPRATPRLVIFLYPGRVSVERLRALREVFVDLEVVVDPCDRAVCREAVGRHIEMIGRSIGKPVIATPDYKIVFKTVRLQTATQMREQELERYVIPVEECIAASTTPGGGAAWLDNRRRADTDYEPLLIEAIQRNARGRRVTLAAAPAVHRADGAVDVGLAVRADRSRWEQQLADALWSVGAAIKASPASPPEARLAVELASDQRGARPRRFRSAGSSVAMFVDQRIDQATLLGSYVEEIKQGKDAPQRMDFNDAEASGRADVGGAAPDDDAAVAVLAANFGSLAACARAEAARNPRFHAVTIGFSWSPDGRAEQIAPREPALRGGPLAKCLDEAVGRLALPRFAGSPRTIEYPIRLQ